MKDAILSAIFCNLAFNVVKMRATRRRELRILSSYFSRQLDTHTYTMYLYSFTHMYIRVYGGYRL